MRTNSVQDADLIVQKLPCDMGIHRNPRKGTLDAPEEILEDLEFDGKILVDEVFPDEFSLENTQQRIERNTEELAEYGKPVISIGGDHSVSFPVLKALKREHPDLQLVWLDAHLDMKQPVEGHVSHDVVVRELLEQGILEEEDIWIVGTTRIDQDEQEFLEDQDLNVFSSDEIEEFTREFDPGEQPVYLSIDIDVLENVEGTGYPDGEIRPGQVKKVLEAVNPDHADIVEVAPPLDGGKTVEAARVILEMLADNCFEASN